MNTRIRILVLISLAITWCLHGFAQQTMNLDQYGKWGAIIQSAQNILAGKSPDKTTITIAPDAYLVAGKRFENLQGVINGEIKGCSLNEAPSRQAVWLHLKANNQENAVVLVLKTQSEKKTDDRFHTVVFMKGTTGQWSMQSWHASE